MLEFSISDMTDHSSPAGQANSLSNLFDDADEALSEYKRAKSQSSSDRFDQVMSQISHNFQELTESYEKTSSITPERQKNLEYATISVRCALHMLNELKAEADSGIVRQFFAQHMSRDSRSLARDMRRELTYFFKD
jgi:hypothetical protein